jgi:hypothetical protein
MDVEFAGWWTGRLRFRDSYPELKNLKLVKLDGYVDFSELAD